MGLLLFALLWFGGCAFISPDEGDRGPEFQNRTDVAVAISFVSAEGSEVTIYRQLEPGAVVNVDVFSTDCSRGAVFIARDGAGAEVARWEGPACRATKWVIEAGPTSSP